MAWLIPSFATSWTGIIKFTQYWDFGKNRTKIKNLLDSCILPNRTDIASLTFTGSTPTSNTFLYLPYFAFLFEFRWWVYIWSLSQSSYSLNIWMNSFFLGTGLLCFKNLSSICYLPFIRYRWCVEYWRQSHQ